MDTFRAYTLWCDLLSCHPNALKGGALILYANSFSGLCEAFGKGVRNEKGQHDPFADNKKRKEEKLVEKRKNNQPIFRLTRKNQTNKKPALVALFWEGGGGWCGDERGVIVPFATPPLYFVPRKNKHNCLFWRRGQCGDEMGTSYHSQPPPLYWFNLRKQKQTNKHGPCCFTLKKGAVSRWKGCDRTLHNTPPPFID